MRKVLLLIFICLSGISSWTQPDLDSLLAIWQDDTYSDTIRLETVQNIALGVYLFSQPDSAFYYAQLQYDFSECKGLKKPMANALLIQGVSYQFKNDYPHALQHYQESLSVYEVIEDKLGKANINEATYELVKENSEFDLTSRGKIEVKGKGEMEIYFVNSTTNSSKR
jgi:hypothetical protein